MGAEMRILLINPRFPDSFWSWRWALTEILPGRKVGSPPLGLATVAALCPPHWEVSIADENIESIPLEPDADIIGICGMGVQFERQRELLAYYRSRGYFVIAGGSFASLCPEHYETLADSVLAGEAEYIFPQFCRDFEAGSPKKLYREEGTVELADSPTPRYDLLKLDRYVRVSVQFSRGCPFRCEFCDIIVMFGRRPRVKTFDQIGRELDELRRFGVRDVFFVDDNLIGNLPVAKKLLQFLKDYQQKHEYWFCFGTEASLNMAQHPDLLSLFRAANFAWVFIGIESTNPASLKETLKTQNLHEDILTSVRRIYSHGIEVMGGFIIGFDHDTVETFDQQYQFITDAGFPHAMISLLIALPKTPLYERLEREGRLNAREAGKDNTRPGTNVIPKSMAYDALIDGYIALYRRLLSDGEIARRSRNKLRHLAPTSYRTSYSAGQTLGIVWRLVRRGILPGGPSRVFHFLSTLPLLKPSLISMVVADWIAALSMRDFAERRLDTSEDTPEACETAVRALTATLRPYLDQGATTVHARAAHAPELSICVRGPVDAAFFRRAEPHLASFLKHRRASLNLRIDAPIAEHSRPMQALLRRIERYGDRVSIALSDYSRAAVPIDSSVFNLVFAPQSQSGVRPDSAVLERVDK
jgi:radical SAM superfamily enzyme YgiQ (UPF0313 family)